MTNRLFYCHFSQNSIYDSSNPSNIYHFDLKLFNFNIFEWMRISFNALINLEFGNLMFARLIVVVSPSVFVVMISMKKKIVWFGAMNRILVGRTSIYSICWYSNFNDTRIIICALGFARPAVMYVYAEEWSETETETITITCVVR